jgi:hypothetical protein
MADSASGFLLSRGVGRQSRRSRVKVPFEMSRRQRLAVGVGLALALVVSLAFGPIVRGRAERAFARRGLTVDIGRVWPGFGGVRLRRVKIRAGQPEWLRAELVALDVDVGFSLAPRRITVRGGEVSLSGSIDAVADHLRDLTRSSEPDAGSSKPSHGPEIRVEGLVVNWAGVVEPSDTLAIEGARFERSARDGNDEAEDGRMGATSVRFARGPVHGAAHELLARFTRERGKTKWHEVHAGAAEIALALDQTDAVAEALGSDRAGGSPETGADEGAPPQKRGVRLRNRIIRAAAWVSESFAEAAPCDVSGLSIALTGGDQTLNLGPGSLRLVPMRDRIDVELMPGAAVKGPGSGDSSPLSLRATIPSTPAEITLHVQGGPVTLASLGVHEKDFGLFNVGKTKLEARAGITLSADADALRFDGEGQLRSLSIVHAKLAEDPVEGLDLAWRAVGAIERGGALVRIDESKIDLGAIRVEANGAVERGDDFIRIDGRLGVPLSDCQRMLESIPHALVPKVGAMTMAGSFSLKSSFTFDTRKPDNMNVDWDLKNRCRITYAPHEIDVARFRNPFEREVYDEKGHKAEILSGPGTAGWVPLEAISPFMEAAVTTTEDGGFRHHGGFDKGAIKNSIRDDLRTGKFLRGASTISMQLAKNLYLPRSKSLSRKLQEAILTIYLEQEMTKDRILELYFNIVEFGPMIYGIGPAAAHYFSTTPFDLSLGQALFLSSILPAPKRIYFGADGQVAKGWLGYLHKLMKIMRDRNRITDQELSEGLSEMITYHVAKPPRSHGAVDWQSDMGWPAWEGP